MEHTSNSFASSRMSFVLIILKFMINNLLNIFYEYSTTKRLRINSKHFYEIRKSIMASSEIEIRFLARYIQVGTCKVLDR